MAGDNRDWYRDWWKKKTGYVERAAFRMSEGERKRAQHKAAWRRNWLVLGLFVLGFLLLLVLKRL
jgi:hypothetical protein